MRGLKIFGVSIGAAFTCAFVFVVTLQRSLPESDGTHGIPVVQLFSDPSVLVGATCGAIIFAVFTFPFAYFAVRDRRLLTSTLFVFGVVIAEILLVTPFEGWRALVGCIPALIMGLAVCRFSGWKWFAQIKTP